jgi:protein arginine kinase activator
MMCERCEQRLANVFVTEIINDHKRSLHLCEQCAREIQLESHGFVPQLNLPVFFASLLGNEINLPSAEQPLADGDNKCENCGLTEKQFLKNGLLGCGACYEYFHARLEPVLRRVHGTTQHKGKVPGINKTYLKKIRKVEDLKTKLQEAVRNEDFEQATQLRDTIKELERKPEQEGG